MIDRAVSRVLPHSIAARLAALFALASTLLLAAIGVYLYGTLGKELATQNDEHLTSMTELVRRVLDDVPSLDRLREEPDLVTHLLVGHELRLWIYGDDRAMLFSSSGTPLPAAAWSNISRPEASGITSGIWYDTARSAYRLAALRIDADKPGLRNSTVILALDVSEEVRVLRSFKFDLLGAMVAGALFAAGAGFLIAARGLRPVLRIAKLAQGITASQLQARLDMSGVPQELHALVESFNTMLARLEESFHRLSDFSADLAHELRTPLTSLLGRSQVTLSKARTSDEYREALESNVEEIEQLSRLVSDMLFLAQADRAETALEHKDIELRAEAGHVAEFFSAACEERGIAIAVHGGATIRADRMMVRRALANLLSNAIRHSPDGGRVEVAIEHGNSTATVSVIDHGPGIAPEHQARIFDRFYRADQSRTRKAGGTGLGLAIVRSIARLHGGDVSIASEPGKATVFAFTLPARLTKL